MNIHENSWKISLGLMRVPGHLYEPLVAPKWSDEVIKAPPKINPYYKAEVKAMCERIREVVKQKILGGHKDAKVEFFYTNLLDSGMLTYPNGKIMSESAVHKHIAEVKLSLGIPRRTDKGKRIFKLFDVGMSEKDISIFLDINPTTVYYALLRSGRIASRPRVRKVQRDELIKYGKNKKEALKNMHACGYSVDDICETLNTNKYYVADCLSGKA